MHDTYSLSNIKPKIYTGSEKLQKNNKKQGVIKQETIQIKESF